MLKHIENNQCRNHWTIQHLNALALECDGFWHLIHAGRETSFRAGAPPLDTKGSDYIPRHHTFVCPICREEYERESQLKEHLKEGECSKDYPSVLQCTWCPGTGFKRLSELFGHFERKRGRCDQRWAASLANSLEKKFEDSGVQQRLNRDVHELRADPKRPGKGKLKVETRSLDDDELRDYYDRWQY